MPDRTSNQCVAAGINIEAKVINSGAIEDVAIENLQCVFNVINEGQRNEDYVRNQYFNHLVMNHNGTAVAPLFKYKYAIHEKSMPLYQITVQPPDESNLPVSILTATEWHPILVIKGRATVVALLSKRDKVLLKDGNVGTITDIIFDVPQVANVYGLSLGNYKKDATAEQREAWFEDIRGLLQNGRGGANKFELDSLADHIMYTNNIATGSLVFQHILSSQLAQGVEY